MKINCQTVLVALTSLAFILADDGLPDAIPMAESDLTSTQATTSFGKPKHSQCFNYFLKKDGCVFSAAKKSQRCDDVNAKGGHSIPSDMKLVFKTRTSQSTQETSLLDVTPEGVKVLSSKSSRTDESSELSAEPSKRLVRRYDSELNSFAIAGGDGICGNYSTSQPGVCLMASADDVPGSRSGGWLNGTYHKACRRQVYIQRKGDPSSVIYAPVVDGCSFVQNNAVVLPEPGCFRIAFTQATFDALKPTSEESSSGNMEDLIWNFNNPSGDKPENAAV